MKVVLKINGYLLEGENIFINSLSKPISNVTKMIRVSSPCDNGVFSFTEEEKNIFIQQNPLFKKHIKEYIGAQAEIMTEELIKMSKG